MVRLPDGTGPDLSSCHPDRLPSVVELLQLGLHASVCVRRTDRHPSPAFGGVHLTSEKQVWCGERL